MKLVKVVVEIRIPDGATHYTGHLDDPTWYKQHSIAGVTYWNYWDTTRNEWMVGSEQRPNWLYEIPLADNLEKDSARYQYLKSRARQEGRDGGYVQIYTLPTFLKSEPSNVMHSDLDECIDCEISKLVPNSMVRK